MRKTLALFLLVFLLVPQSVLADGIIIPPKDQNIIQAQQRALIVHQGGIEDLIISLEFRGDAKEFAWFLPVPEKPEIKRGEDEVFTKLARLTKPKKNLLEKIKGERKYLPLPLFGEVGRGVPAEEKVEVVETKRVGILDVSVLKATKSADLETWLKENGYQIPGEEKRLRGMPLPEKEREVFAPPTRGWLTINRTRQIFQEYLDKGWYFVAAKIATEFLEEFPKPTVSPPPKVPSPTEKEKAYYPRPPQYFGQAHITPLHLTFKTEKIVYPMKITSLENSSPNVLLYVLSDHKKAVTNYRYQYVKREGEENFIFKTKYAARISGQELKEWLPKVKDGYLTKLYASSLSPAQMKEDLRFEDAREDKTVNAGEMRKKDWLLLPLYLGIYGPIRILEWFSRYPSGFYRPLVQLGPIIPLLLISFLGGGGVLWVIVFYFLLSRTRKRLLRAILYLLQFPGVWILVNLLSLIFVLPCLVVLLLLKVDPVVMASHLLLENNLGAVFFTAIFYSLQSKIHLIFKK